MDLDPIDEQLGAIAGFAAIAPGLRRRRKDLDDIEAIRATLAEPPQPPS